MLLSLKPYSSHYIIVILSPAIEFDETDEIHTSKHLVLPKYRSSYSVELQHL